MDLTQILDLVRQHGDAAYGFVFAYAAGNSLLMVLFAGYAAHMAVFDWGKLILVCWAGSFMGDAIRFWIGRRFGTRWLTSFPRIERGVQTAARLVDRHYLWMLFIHRYPHGIRSLAGFAFGISGLPRPTFLALNFVSAGLWSLAVVSAGYAFGQVSEKVLSQTASGLSLAALLAFLALFWVLGKHLESAVERSSVRGRDAV
jgi:membrane protein DedA with SNARE-associated domain